MSSTPGICSHARSRTDLGWTWAFLREERHSASAAQHCALAFPRNEVPKALLGQQSPHSSLGAEGE